LITTRPYSDVLAYMYIIYTLFSVLDNNFRYCEVDDNAAFYIQCNRIRFCHHIHCNMNYDTRCVVELMPPKVYKTLLYFAIIFYFDTIDHSILTTRLSSWFGIHGSFLNWFKSYLSSRSFHVKCGNHMSSLQTCLCGVYQGSVLRPLLFIMYTTSLITLTSSLSKSSLLCIWSSSFFYPCDLDANITLLYNALKHIFSWMTANQLTFQNRISSHLTQSPTSQISQLPDRNDPLRAQSRHNFRWTHHFLWPSPNIITIQILLFSYLCTFLYPSVSWLQNCLYYCTSIVHSKLDYCNSITTLESAKFSDKSTSTNPSLSRSHCCQIS